MKENQRLRAAGFEPPVHAPNAALMIDFDNVTMGIRSDLQSQLKRLLASDVFKGKVSVQRAYADWRRYPQYIVPLSESSIDLIFAPAFGSNKKNATDIRLAIDATELVFTRPEIGTFILLSGDSDFSSLVLKLKEYGKYVIGVGIRESSSDLLIQNCDEYYSYNELTGLARESDAEHPRHDPWELVVEAVTRMKQNRDVMRSDRLKQVMQEIDPNFDEGEVGFSRFSKFVLEASSRGLVRLTKLDNGQFEIDLGSNANVSPAVETALAEAASRPAAERPSRRRGGGRERSERAAGGRGVTLAQAFDALRDVLLSLGAVGGESTDAEQVRERMVERFGAEDPIVEENRFQRLLRQAHDASVVELAKGEDDTYLIRLGTSAGVGESTESVAGSDEEATDTGRSEGASRTRDRRRGGRGRGRGRREERRPERDDRPRGDVEADRAPAPQAAAPTPAPPPTSSQQPAAGGSDARRSVRFRSGSRRAGPPAAPAAASPPAGAATRPPAPTPAPGEEAGTHRSGRGRGGSRGPQRDTGEAQPREPRAAVPETRPRVEVPPAPPATPKVAPADPSDEAPRSLFKRMSAALQKALGSEEPPE